MTRHHKKDRLSPRQFHLETLERRILFSADAALTALDVVSAADPEVVLWKQSQHAEQVTRESALTSEIKARELLIVDSSVKDLQNLLADIKRSPVESSIVMVLDEKTDALSQISEILEDQRNLTALHVISQRSDGALELAGQRIETLDLLSRAGEIATWRNALAPGANITLNGYVVAADGTGQQFIDTLARLTGAVVSASNDLTSSADKAEDRQSESQRDGIGQRVDVLTGRSGIDVERSQNTETPFARLLDDSMKAFEMASLATSLTPQTLTHDDIASESNGPLSSIDTLTISLLDTPLSGRTVPATQTIDEDSDLTFTRGTATELSVTDTLVGDNEMQVSLSVNDGILQLSRLTGITFVEGADGSASITFKGIESDINAALDGMKFTPDSDFAGGVMLNMMTTLTSGVTESSNVVITVNAINDAPTFNSGDGTVAFDISVGESFAASYHLPNGKTLIAGANPINPSGQMMLMQVNSDGSLDSSFGNNGIVYTDFGGYYEFATAVVVQSDGKILVGGTSSTQFLQAEDFSVARYNTDGTLDTSFDADGKVTITVGNDSDRLYGIGLQADGKILLTGESVNGTNDDLAVVRLNANGSLDNSFDGDGILTLPVGTAYDTGRAVRVQADGRIVVGGFYEITNSDHDAFFVRLNADGTLDSSFGSDGIVTTDYGFRSLDQMTEFVFDSQERIVSVGYDETNSVSVITRYQTDGSLDTTFDTDGFATTDASSGDKQLSNVVLQPDGKIIASGYAYSGIDNDVLIARFDTDGSLDSTFDGDGLATIDLGSNERSVQVHIGTSGDIMVPVQIRDASFSTVSGGMVRLNSDGSTDQQFNASNTLDGNPTFIENGPAVLLDSNVEIFDAELSEIDDFFGSKLTLQRNTGSDNEDIFSASGNLSFVGIPSLGNIELSSTHIGTYTNGNGRLNLSFSSGVSNTQVNEVMQSIAYSNSSDTPPENVQINWTFDDGGIATAQGSGGGGGGGLTDSGSLTVNITATNDAPSLVAISNDTITENTNTNSGTSIGTLSSTDVDSGESFTYIIAGGTDAAVFSIGGTGSDELILTDGVLDYESQSSYEIRIRTTDAGGLTHDQDLVISVTDVNETPALIAISNNTITENTDTSSGTAIGTFNSTDTNTGNTFTYTIAGGTDAAVFSIGGTGSDELILTDGVLDYESQSSYEVTIRTTNPGGQTHDRDLVISVTDVTEAPTLIAISNNTITENTDTSSGIAIGTLNSTDVDSGESFTYIIAGGTDAAVFSIGGTGSDELILTDGVLDYESQSSYEVTIRTTDAGGLTHDQDFVISVTDVNETPTLVTISNNTITENTDTSSGTLIGTLNSIDVDSDESFTYIISGGTDAAMFDVGGAGSNQLILTDGVLDYESQSSYEVIVSTIDSGDLMHDQTFNIIVTNVNEEPVITSAAAVSVAEHQANVLTVISSDVDSDTLSYSLTGGRDISLFDIDSNSGALTFKNAPDFETPGDVGADNTYNVTVQVTDGNGGTATQTIGVTVTNVNEAPVIIDTADGSGGGENTALNITVNENQTAAIGVSAADVDEDSELRYTVTGGADQSAFTINPGTGILKFVSPPDYELKDRYEVEVTITDDGGLTAVRTLAFNIQDVNESPTAQSDTLKVNENQLLIIDPVFSLLSNDTDPEQDSLTLVSFSQPENGTLTLNTQGQLAYEPTEHFVGLDSFEYIVKDSGGLQVSARVWLDVNPLSDPILAAAQLANNGIAETLVSNAKKIETTQTDVPTDITTAFKQETIISASKEHTEPVAVSDEASSSAFSTEDLFTDLASKIVEQQTPESTNQAAPDGFNVPITSGLLAQLLEHEISDLNTNFELQVFDQSASIELRDAILVLRGHIDQIMDQANDPSVLSTFAPSIAGASLTAGIVTWVLRSGLLISAAITATPLWRPLDPIPILAHSEDNEPWYEEDMPGDSSHRKQAANDSESQDEKNG